MHPGLELTNISTQINATGKHTVTKNRRAVPAMAYCQTHFAQRTLLALSNDRVGQGLDRSPHKLIAVSCMNV